MLCATMKTYATVLWDMQIREKNIFFYKKQKIYDLPMEFFRNDRYNNKKRGDVHGT